MRVRTYCFPGCFTRPPGTSTRNHPHEPTTSKPVVPRGYVSGNSSRLGLIDHCPEPREEDRQHLSEQAVGYGVPLQELLQGEAVAHREHHPRQLIEGHG